MGFILYNFSHHREATICEPVSHIALAKLKLFCDLMSVSHVSDLLGVVTHHAGRVLLLPIMHA